MKFKSKDGKFSFVLGNALVPQLVKHIIQAKGNETGGILIGNYNTEHSEATLRTLSGPPKDSRSGFSWFQRGMYGLQRLLNKHWNKNEYYLGEWHYHPFSSPTPSFQDMQQMKQIASTKSYHCPEPILLIIGGTPDNYEIKLFIVSRQMFFELPEVNMHDPMN